MNWFFLCINKYHGYSKDRHIFFPPLNCFGINQKRCTLTQSNIWQSSFGTQQSRKIDITIVASFSKALKKDHTNNFFYAVSQYSFFPIVYFGPPRVDFAA